MAEVRMKGILLGTFRFESSCTYFAYLQIKQNSKLSFFHTTKKEEFASNEYMFLLLYIYSNPTSMKQILLTSNFNYLTNDG